MTDTSVYLDKLSSFARILQMKGIKLSFRETEDAARILTETGFEQRDTVKTVLRAVYAKTREEQILFDSVFDSFFLSEEKIRQQAEQNRQREQEAAKQREEAQKELEKYGDQVQLSAQQKETYTQMSEEARQRLRSFMDRYRGNIERNPTLYSEFIHSVFTKTILEQQMLMESAGENCFETDPEVGILYRELSNFQDNEIPKAIEMIQTIAKQINGELSAKHHKRAGLDRLDFRKTIRKGLETGGSLRTLRYKPKRLRRKRLVLLCDVSGSMIQFSEFALRFVQSLNRVSADSVTYLFSEKTIRTDSFLMEKMDTFRSFIRDSSIYGKGTDLGSALQTLCDEKQSVLGKGVTLLILSDTKTIDQNRAVQQLIETKRHCEKIIWMNPIPQQKWKYLRSVQVFSSVVPMISCSTLKELENACRSLVLR